MDALARQQRRRLAALMSAHAVSDDPQPPLVVSEEAVLIMIALHTHVTMGSPFKGELRHLVWLVIDLDGVISTGCLNEDFQIVVSPPNGDLSLNAWLATSLQSLELHSYLVANND